MPLLYGRYACVLSSSPGAIKTYLAAMHCPQIVQGLPKHRAATSPRLKLTERGIRRERARTGSVSVTRLLITPPLLHQLRAVYHTGNPTFADLLMWAMAVVCCFGFFSAGEITVPSASAYDPSANLSWRDVAITKDQQVVQVFHRWSKMDQYGRGTGFSGNSFRIGAATAAAQVGLPDSVIQALG